MNKDGFTLLEVTLFLAISSGLALIAFVGLGPKLRNVKFTDSVRGLEASIVRQMSNSEKGSVLSSTGKSCVNEGGKVVVKDGNSQKGTSADCVVNGGIAHFENSKVTYREIISLREPEGCPNEDYERDLDQLIKCFKPLIYNGATSTYTYTNGLIMSGSPEAKAIGIISNPKTNTQYNFLLKNTSAFSWVYSGYIDVPVPFLLSQDANSSFCFKSGNRRVKYSFDTNTYVPKVEFEGVCS